MDRDQIIKTIRANRSILDKHSVSSLSMFGSVARNEASSESDIDLLVDFYSHAHIGLFSFVALQIDLSTILGRKVDLVTRDAIHPALEEKIMKDLIHVA